MTDYAQTNIQLYNQLRRAGSAEADLRRIHAAYELAVSLFAGQLRPNHKPFLAHLVGTASILLAHAASADVAAAGLLHSAYSHGEFGDGSRGVKLFKQRSVRRAVGEECESLVADYATFPWNPAQFEELLAGPMLATTAIRDVILVRLADLLEEYLDEGLSYSPRKRLPVDATSPGTRRDGVVRLASALGRDRLAAELRAALDPAVLSETPSFLCGSHQASLVVAPRSHRLKLFVRLRRFYGRYRRKLARRIRHRPASQTVAPIRNGSLRSAE